MRSRTTRQLRKLVSELPARIRKQARKAYEVFRDNPNHPGLQFKKVHQTEPVYSARINLDDRAIGFLRNDYVVWSWIGPHTEYEEMLKRT